MYVSNTIDFLSPQEVLPSLNKLGKSNGSVKVGKLLIEVYLCIISKTQPK